jgi:hypothetical protein
MWQFLSLSLVLSAFAFQDAPKRRNAFPGFDPKAMEAVRIATQADHKQMMQQLKIEKLRPGANGNDPKAANAANYDEAKATPFPYLPDPLTLKNGSKVVSADMWWKDRRPEIVEDFDREIYGRVPKDVPKVEWKVASQADEKVGETPVVVKRLVGKVDNSSHPGISVDIQLSLTTPTNAKVPVPVVMEFGFGGRGFGPPGGGPRGPTWQEQVIAKGWGYAIIVPNSIQADNGAGLTKGIIGLCNKGQPRKPDDWGSLRAWAWGASRALDYFETDKAVDAKKVAIEGLSRYGKAAIVAMAYDDRFAVGFIGSSGAGGLKLHRRNFGELVENVASSGEYHWMAGNYLKYAGPLKWSDLPVDSHELLAMCAPRPVFISVGAPNVEGQWIDAKGMFLAGVHAGPVYKLLGKKDLGTTEFPPLKTALIDGEIAFRQHEGAHTTGPNWPTFLTFAERYFSNPSVELKSISATEAAPKADFTLKDVAWFAGHWRTQSSSLLQEEFWSDAAGKAMVGTFRLVSNGKPVVYEFLLIEEQSDGVWMLLRHFNVGMKEREQLPVKCKLVKATAEEAVFENQSGDKPKRIVYAQTKKGELVVTVETVRDGKTVTFPLSFDRVKK